MSETSPEQPPEQPPAAGADAEPAPGPEQRVPRRGWGSLLLVVAVLLVLAGLGGYQYTRRFGERLQLAPNQTLHYDGVSREQAERVRDFLLEKNFLEDEPADVRLTPLPEGGLAVGFAFVPGAWDDPEAQRIYGAFRRRLEAHLETPVEVHLCDSSLTPQVVLEAAGPRPPQ